MTSQPEPEKVKEDKPQTLAEILDQMRKENEKTLALLRQARAIVEMRDGDPWPTGGGDIYGV
jgi:hypothetical protein